MTSLLYKPDKSREDVEQLLSQHKNLIYYMLRNMGQLYNQDCESAAWEALWDAVCTFDIYSKAQFSTYACTLIRNAINDVLRKQALINKYETAMFEYTDQCELDAIPAQNRSADEVNTVEVLFREFLINCKPVAKAILQAWRASGFEMHGNELAKMCGSTTSYVSRVKRSFRVFLKERVKG